MSASNRQLTARNTQLRKENSELRRALNRECRENERLRIAHGRGRICPRCGCVQVRWPSARQDALAHDAHAEQERFIASLFEKETP